MGKSSKCKGPGVGHGWDVQGARESLQLKRVMSSEEGVYQLRGLDPRLWKTLKDVVRTLTLTPSELEGFGGFELKTDSFLSSSRPGLFSGVLCCLMEGTLCPVTSFAFLKQELQL